LLVINYKSQISVLLTSGKSSSYRSSMGFDQHIEQVYAHLKGNLKCRPRDKEWRVAQLKALRRLLQENDEALCAAMWKDLRKSRFECVATEQGIVLSEIEHALRNLNSWMKPQSVRTPLYNQPGICEIRHEPLGLVLIIGAWNYPINLLLAPMVGAIAAGNAILLKPSELSQHTTQLLVQLLPQYMDSDLIAIIEAGPAETSILLNFSFDLVFFTGSGAIGKIVMSKSAQNLTPVVLELGGKSPALVLADADIEVAARRIAWGKFMNAGQTCVAPDYILVQPSVKQQLVSEIKKCLHQFYGAAPQRSLDYCRIINQKNYDRLISFLVGEKILAGGGADADDLYIEPTLIEGQWNSLVMQEEIFGPILPIIEVGEIEKMISLVNGKPKPLSLYLFTRDRSHQELVLQGTSSGGVSVNDVVMHMPVPGLPFGGVGASGMGHYHGEFSFKTFSHAKGILRKSTWMDIPIRYAPYSIRNIKILRWLF